MFQKLPSSYLYRAEQWEVKLLGLCRSQELWDLCLADTDVQYSTVQSCTEMYSASAKVSCRPGDSGLVTPAPSSTTLLIPLIFILFMASNVLHTAALAGSDDPVRNIQWYVQWYVKIYAEHSAGPDIDCHLMAVLCTAVVCTRLLEWPRARLASSSNQGGLCLSAGVNLPCINYRKNDINLRWRD